MKPAAHRDLIIAMRYRPGADPTTKLVMRLDHDHWNAPFGQPNGGRNASNAPAGHDDGPRRAGKPRRAARRGMTDCASITARSPAIVTAPDDHEAAEGLRARQI
jgi:hypothetical protein